MNNQFFCESSPAFERDVQKAVALLEREPDLETVEAVRVLCPQQTLPVLLQELAANPCYQVVCDEYFREDSHPLTPDGEEMDVDFRTFLHMEHARYWQRIVGQIQWFQARKKAAAPTF